MIWKRQEPPGRPGRARGDAASPDGTSSALRWRSGSWGSRSTSTAALGTSCTRTITRRTRSPSSSRGARSRTSTSTAGSSCEGGAKMSKSVGNLVPLRTALAAVGPSALRWYLLDRPYPDRLAWDPRKLARAEREYESIRRTLASWISPGRGGRGSSAAARAVAEHVRHELLGGLRTDRAFDRLRAFVREIERDRPAGSPPERGPERAPRSDRSRTVPASRSSRTGARPRGSARSRRPCTGWPGRAARATGRARGRAKRRSGPRSPRSGGRARSPRRGR